MKKLIVLVLLAAFLINPSAIFAQPMTGKQFQSATDDHTAGEEAEGKEIWERLQSKQIICNELSYGNFGSLGEYYIGQMVGDTGRHAVMNQMMTAMLGETSEEKMHVVMGKRMSGCYTGTKGGGNPMMGYGWNNMMGGWGGFGLGWVFMILFWALIILGVVGLIRYLSGQHNADKGKTPLDILRERYAKGEVDKKEFEEMKKDLR